MLYHFYNFDIHDSDSADAIKKLFGID